MMRNRICVRCKECNELFHDNAVIDLAALERDDQTMTVVICPHCNSLRPYRQRDTEVASTPR